MRRAFLSNWRLYLCEALGLAVFMVSACFFSAMLEGDTAWHRAIPDAFLRLVITGVLMGATALAIFYAPWTAPSGSQINPAVTLAFLRLGKMKSWDAAFYITFQILGGTAAVYAMALLMGKPLTAAPVNYAATVPAGGVVKAFVVEILIAFLMMMMVLHTSAHGRWRKYTRLFSGCAVCAFVIVAGPISGFGMNPARSLASAIPSGTWTAFWIYAFAPVAGMLLAAEVYLTVQRRRRNRLLQHAFIRYTKQQQTEMLND